MVRNSNPISSTLSLVSLFAMLCVLWWHCTCGSLVQEFFIPAFCTWSVPWFFVVSGIFFRDSITRKGARRFALGKIRSLVVPYLLWCMIGFCISFSVVRGNGIMDLFGVLRSPVWNQALWYLRALIWFSVIGVLVYCVTSRWERYGWILFSIVFAFIVLVINKYCIMVYGPNSSPMYFLLGVLVSKKLLSGAGFGKYNILVGFGCLVAAMCFRLFWFWQGYRLSVMGGTFWANCSTILIIVALFVLVKVILEHVALNQFVKECCSMTAFVYFLHVPCNSVLKTHLPDVNRNLMFLFLLIVCPVIYMMVAFVIKKLFRNVYSVLSGGR